MPLLLGLTAGTILMAVAYKQSLFVQPGVIPIVGAWIVAEIGHALTDGPRANCGKPEWLWQAWRG